MTRDDWKQLFELRDDLEDEDKALMRKFIKHTEKLERVITAVIRLLDNTEV